MSENPSHPRPLLLTDPVDNRPGKTCGCAPQPM